jgi:molybdopterin-guanine dinucleotide biosynthesis protein A
MAAPNGVALKHVVGFAVAGGESRRMGSDKARLRWGPGDLLDHALARLSVVAPDVRILCGPKARYTERGRAVCPDVVEGGGALAALVTALRDLADDQTAVLLAVDLPLVSPDLLRHLLARASGVDAVVPVSAAGAEPFAAVYHASCRPAVERAWSEGRLKMTAFWPDVRVREAAAGELAPFGPDAFANVNTPEEYERQKAKARA